MGCGHHMADGRVAVAPPNKLGEQLKPGRPDALYPWAGAQFGMEVTNLGLSAWKVGFLQYRDSVETIEKLELVVEKHGERATFLCNVGVVKPVLKQGDAPDRDS